MYWNPWSSSLFASTVFKCNHHSDLRCWQQIDMLSRTKEPNKTTHPPLFFTAFQNRSFILITAFGRGLPIRSVSSYRIFLLSTSCHRYRSCQLAKRTDPILSSQLDSITAKGVYASSDQSNIMRSRRSIQSPISKRRETNFQSSLLRSDSQGKHCHPIGLSFFQHHVTDIGLVS